MSRSSSPRTTSTTWALRFTPGLCIGNSFKWYALQDRQAYTAWLREELAERPPSLLVPCHGHVHELEPGAMEALVDRRLGS